MMKAKDLKNSILQMAVEGKLVPQDPADEPASALLDRIREERRKLITEGKLKFPKSGESIIYRASDGSPYEKRVDTKGHMLSDECIEDEIPFEIPESWEWARLETAVINRDAERIPVSVADREKLQKIYDYYGASGVIDKVDNYLFDKPLLLVGEDGANLLMRSKPIAFLARGKYWVNNHAHVLDGISEDYLEYIALYLNSISLAPYVTGTAQPKMNQARMGTILIPIPPETEQRRILSKIAELLPLVEEYGRLEDAREELDSSLPDRLRKSVLQEAVEGRLVSQNPADEPASALLSRIRKERRKLITEGELKFPKGGESIIYRASDGARYEKRVDAKGRVLSDECIEDEIPFEIPDSWEWARVESLTQLINGKAFKPADWTKDGLPIVRIQNLNNPDNPFNRYAGEIEERFHLHGGELLFAWSGTPGTSFGAHIWTGGEALLNQHIFNVKYPVGEMDKSYFELSLNQSVIALIELAHGSAGLQHVTRGVFESTLIPIPPLAEQHRIVTAVNEVLALLN